MAYIAECNLSPKAQRIAEKYLGHSIVYFSSWMDDYRRSPGYEHTTYWHMAPVDERMYYTDEVRSSRGDAVCELENAIGLLKNYRQLDDSTVAANLRYVIHLVGDMHCPAHVDYPGVELWYDVSFNGKKRSYHSVWDSGIIEASRKWHYVEWQQQLDRCTRRQKREIMAGHAARLVPPDGGRVPRHLCVGSSGVRARARFYQCRFSPCRTSDSQGRISFGQSAERPFRIGGEGKALPGCMAWLSGRRFAAEFRTLESVSAMAFALVQGLERRDGPESVGGAVTNLPRSERPGADRGVSQSSATSFLLGVRAVRI